MAYLRGFLGILILLFIAYLLSSYRKKVDWKLVASGLALQIVIALLVLKVPLIRNAFDAIGSGFVKFLRSYQLRSAVLIWRFGEK